MDMEHDIVARVWALGDHVNTDMLHPPEYFSLDARRLREGIRQGGLRLGAALPGENTAEGFIIVAGENFGCGSSRETSVRALAACGLRAVVARSFARIFYRSLVNQGIPAVVCDGVQDSACSGDILRVSPAGARVELDGGQRFACRALDQHSAEILACGGLLSYLHRERHGL